VRETVDPAQRDSSSIMRKAMFV